MEIEIRELRKENDLALDALYSEITKVAYPEYSPKVIEFFLSDVQKKKWLNLPIRLGAFAGNTLVGFLLAEKPFGGVMFISWLAIKQDYRGKGIGKKLLEEITQKANKLFVHNLHLRCDKRNLPFYQKAGYEQFGLDKKGYFGTDDYLMKKVLGEPNEAKFLPND